MVLAYLTIVGALLLLAATGDAFISSLWGVAAYAVAQLLVCGVAMRAPSMHTQTPTDCRIHRLHLCSTNILVVAVLLRLAFLAYPISPAMVPDIAPLQGLSASNTHFSASNKTRLAPVPASVQWGLTTVLPNEGSSADTTCLAIKVITLLCDIIVLLLLRRLLREWRRPPQWLALYGLSPLVLVFGVGHGHLIVIIEVVFVVAGLLAFARERWSIMYVLAGFAVLTHPTALIMLPFVVKRQNRHWLPLAGVPLLTAVLLEPQSIVSWATIGPSSTGVGLLPHLLRPLMPNSSELVALVFFVNVLFWGWMVFQAQPIYTLGIVWITLLVCAPNVQPWMVIPVVILVSHTPNRVAFVLFATLGITLLGDGWSTDIDERSSSNSLGVMSVRLWGLLAIWLPVLVALVYALRTRMRAWLPQYGSVTSIDIVMPTLNEESGIERALTALHQAIETLHTTEYTLDINVIVVDGGSTDRTCEIVRRFPVTIVESAACGRGNQFAAGIDAGSATVILMLHADAVMAEDALCRLSERLRRAPTAAWGILGHRYASTSLKMKLIEISNRLRFHIGGLAFGDQGIFIRRECLELAGGVPRMRLMEDVEMSLRCGIFQHRESLGDGLSVSTRRWERKTITGYTLQVLYLVSRYLFQRRLGCDVITLSDTMYTIYYGHRLATNNE